jgi:hypothetical protein
MTALIHLSFIKYVLKQGRIRSSCNVNTGTQHLSDNVCTGPPPSESAVLYAVPSSLSTTNIHDSYLEAQYEDHLPEKRHTRQTRSCCISRCCNSRTWCCSVPLEVSCWQHMSSDDSLVCLTLPSILKTQQEWMRHLCSCTYHSYWVPIEVMHLTRSWNVPSSNIIRGTECSRMYHTLHNHPF